MLRKLTSKSRLKHDSSKCSLQTQLSFCRFSLLSLASHCFLNALFLGKDKSAMFLTLLLSLLQLTAAQMPIFDKLYDANFLTLLLQMKALFKK